MTFPLLCGLLLPFFGTALGAACVLFMKNEPSKSLRRLLTGFAAGVMTAASVWSLLLPAIERSEGLGKFAFLPGALGLWMGIGLLWAGEKCLPLLKKNQTDGPLARIRKTVLAITLHNLPEGMAVGVALAEFCAGGAEAGAAVALAVGIAIQNFPEGAVVSLPLQSAGKGKGKSFLAGVLSGVVEPLGAGLALVGASVAGPVLPLILGLAAGAMLYAVVEELIPDLSRAGDGWGAAFFGAGFTLMMGLDVALG